MKVALIIGIGDYKNMALPGCVSNAMSIGKLLERNYDSSPNFSTKYLCGVNISRELILENVGALLSFDSDCAIIYFCGCGFVDSNGATYLIAGDSSNYYNGINIDDILHLVNLSKVGEVIIILDCVLSIKHGSIYPSRNEMAQLRNGVSILINSESHDEQNSRIFANLFLEAIKGEASDILGNVAISGVYNYLQTRLGHWSQQLVFKSHISHDYPIRKSKQKISWSMLRSLETIFPYPEYEYPLSPSYEKTSDERIPENELTFSSLQQLEREGIIEPVGEELLYFAAINSKSIRLTQTGKLYWKLLRDRRI